MPRLQVLLIAGRLLGCLVVAVLAAAPAVAARNILPNASFEEGPEGWTLWRQEPATSSGSVVEGEARRGKRCFKVENRGTGGANLYSAPVPVRPDADYTLSVYVKTRGATGVAVAAWAVDAEGKVLSHSVGGNMPVPSDLPGYGRFQKAFHTPEGCAGIKAHLICNGGEVWWDGVVLEVGREMGPYRDGPLLKAPENTGNLLVNSGFEEGGVAWTLWHQTPGVSGGGPEPGGQAGRTAFHVRNPGEGGANLFSESVPADPETEYTLSVSARTRGARQAKITLWACDASDQTITHGIGGTPIPADVPDFTRFTVTGKTPPGTAYVRAHFVCGGGEVWWDSAQIENGAMATAYREGPAAGVDPPGHPPEARRYTIAIIREARLQDVLRQARRLLRYREKHPGAGRASEALAKADALAAQVSAGLHAPYLVPDFLHLDYAGVEARMVEAERLLLGIWPALGMRAAPDVRPWKPRLAPNLDRERLARELIIFPCYTRPHFVAGKGDWGILEPFGFRIVSGWTGVGGRPGAYNFGALDEFIRVNAEQGYLSDISADPAAVARHLQETLGDTVFLHTADGKWSPAGNCHNTINIWHPEVVSVGGAFLTAFGEHYRNNPHVSSYELINEPSLTVEERVHGYEYRRLGVGGYSPQARAAWARWLERRYRTVEALNGAWRTGHRAFADAAPPADLKPPAPASGSEPVGIGPIIDFQSFRAESHAEYFRQSVAALRKGDPRRAIMPQFWAGEMGRKDSAVDLLPMSTLPEWDFLGTHDWPGDRPAVLSLYAASMNRYAKLPHWEEEFIWSQWERKDTPEPVMRAATERNLWRQIAWGKRGISLFNLESEWLHDSPNSWNNSLLNIEAELQVPRYSSGVIPTVERKANAVKETLFATDLAPHPMAIVRPTASFLGAAPDGLPQREATAIAAELLARHWMPFLLPEECVLDGRENLDAYRVLLLPWATVVPAGLEERLLAWVEAGGTLIASGPVGLHDAAGKPSGTLMRAVFGPLAWRYEEAAGRWQAEGASTAVLEKAHGKGRVVLFVEPVGVGKRWPELHAEIARAVPVPPISTSIPDLELLLRRDAKGGHYLFAVNLSAREARAGDVALRGQFGPVRDLSVDGSPEVPARRAPGLTLVPLSLAPGEGAFFALGRPDPKGDPGDAAAAAALKQARVEGSRRIMTEMRTVAGRLSGIARVRAETAAALADRILTADPERAAAVARLAGRLEEVAALPAPARVDAVVPRLRSPIVVDGHLDDWPAPPEIAIGPERCVVGTPAGEEDCSARFRLGWDDAGLAIAVSVRDDAPGPRAPDDALYQGDAVELFLDLLDEHALLGSDYHADDFQFFLAADGRHRVQTLLPTPPRPEVKTVRMTGGWVLEARIPWAGLGVKPVSGLTFGFDLGVDDADGDAPRDRQLIWRGRADNFRSTGGFGTVRLE